MVKLWKKIGRIALDVLLYVFVGVCLFGVIVSVVSKKDSDGTANIFGYQMRFVQSPSMEKCALTDTSAYDIQDIPTKSLIFIEVVPENPTEREKWFDELQVGDVVTFKYTYTKQETITHRLTKKTPVEGGYLLELEGDNKNSEDGVLTQIIDTTRTNSTDYVIGKVVGVNYPLGLLVYALKTPVGLICIVIVPCLAIIIFEVIRIVNVLGEDKRQKAKEERDKQQNEIEELKRQLTEIRAKEKTDSRETNDETQRGVE